MLLMYPEHTLQYSCWTPCKRYVLCDHVYYTHMACLTAAAWHCQCQNIFSCSAAQKHATVSLKTDCALLAAQPIAAHFDIGACPEMHCMLQGKGQEGG